MGFKKAILVLLLLIILTMGAASAADTNTTSDNLAATEDMNLEINENDEVLSVDSNDVISDPGNGTYTPKNGSIVAGTFSELASEINSTGPGTLELSRDYYADNGTPNGITIPFNSMTIDGKGHSLYAQGFSNIFTINADNVILKNINFIHTGDGSAGNAIIWNGKYGQLSYSTFTNCLGLKGSATYWAGSSGIISNCTFINCSSTSNGGAVWWGGENGNLNNCYFLNCSSDNMGGAIYWAGYYGTVANSNFLNTSSSMGSAIYWDYEGGRIENSQFNRPIMPNATVIYGNNVVDVVSCAFESSENKTLNDLIFNGNYTNCTVNGRPVRFASLSTQINSDNVIYKKGDTVNLNIIVYNDGPDSADNTFVTLTIPNSLIIIDSDYDLGDFDASTGIWSIDNIPNNFSETLTLSCVAIRVENTTVAAFVSSDAEDLNSTDNIASTDIFILKADTTLTLNVSDIFAGETLQIFIDITPFDAAGNLTININGVEEQSFINGTAIIMKEGLAAGEYNITATYSGDANYLPSQNTTLFRVNKRNVNLTIALDENTITYGQNATLMAIMSIDGIIAININNETYHITTIEKEAHLQIPTLPAGNHTITAIFEGNDQYNPANTTIMLTVNKADPPIRINTTDIKYGQDAIITVTTLPDATGNITLTIDGKNYFANIENGQATFNISGLNAGLYEAIANYAGDDNYRDCQKTTQFSVSKAPTEITAATTAVNLKVLEEFNAGATLTPNVGYLTYISYDESIAIVENGTIKAVGIGTTIITVNFEGNENYEASNKTINVTVTLNDASVSVNNSTVDLKVGDEFRIVATTVPDALNVTYIPDDSGVVSVSENGVVYALKEGNGVITVRVGGDGIYAENSTTVNVSVGKKDTLLTISAEDTTYGENATITATMTTDGTVTININDQNIALEITNGTGQITIPNLNAGEYIVQASYNGNDYYKAANTTTTLTVTKAQSQLTIQPIPETTYGENINIIINVQNDATGTITLTVNDKNYIKNIENGQATFNITGLDAGNYEAIANYAGDANYAENSTTVNVSVGKKDTLLTISAEDTTYGENATITATMTTDGTVTININDQNIALEITNGTGQITIPNLNAGEYIVQASYNGNDYYKAANTTTTLTVTKAQSQLTIQPIPETTYGENINIIINVQNDATGTITLTVNDKNYIKNIENGQTTFNITGLDAGTYEATANYTGDTNYLAAQNSTQFTVKSKTKTFEDITNLISNTHAGDAINLEGTYYGTGSTITVNKELTINGDGKTILDAKNLSGILSVSANNVRINNIRFINGKINANGGAINWIGKNGTISNCTFINCSAENGGSIYWNAENGMINTSTFDKSTATSNGGAIYWNADGGEIADSTFTNSYAQNGGAIYVPENKNVEVKSSRFENNAAKEESGAVYGGTVNPDCTFKDNTYTPVNTKTFISINETTVYVGNDILITTLILNNDKGVLVNTGTVEIYINSELMATIPANTQYIHTTGEIGTYQVMAKFNDDSSYKESSSTSEFTVIPVDIPEEIETSTAGIFTLEFPDDAEGTLTVFIDGTKYKVYDIVGGILTIDLSYKKGKYNVTFEYSGDNNYPAFKKDANITIPINPTITASPSKVLYSAGTTYKITVYKNKGIVAKSASVVIKLNNKKFKTIKTSSKGVASFKITQKPGTYKLKITTLGTTATKTLTVKHILTLKTVKVKKSAKKLILQATLAKVNKKYLKKKTVTFKFNGKTYKAKTNSKGVAKITIKKSALKKLKVGKKVTYQATYLKDTVKKTAKIKK